MSDEGELDPQSIRDSLFLQKLCCDVGFSLEQWKRRIRASNIHNTHYSHLGRYTGSTRYKALHSGSAAEGMAADFLGSDTDIMFVIDGTTVTEHSKGHWDESENVFQMVHVQHSAFVRLLLLLMSSNQDRRLYPTPQYCEVDEEGRMVLNGRRIVENEGGIRHGPAATKAYVGNKEHDCVPSLHCREWPSASEEWIHRHRPFNWPCPSVIEEITNEGCELVAVGRPTGPAPHFEWRLSSSLAERKLIRSLNMVQLQCYLLLKIVLVYLIKPEVPDSLASYHMKTVILQAFENVDPREWTENQLTNCFRKCVHLLLIYLEAGYCPQVFISQHNLFERKIQGTIRFKLVEIVKRLKDEGWKCLLRCLPFSNEQYSCRHLEHRCPCHVRFWKQALMKNQKSNISYGLIYGLYFAQCLLEENASFSFYDAVSSLQAFLSDRVTEDISHFPSAEFSKCIRKMISCHLGYILLAASTTRSIHVRLLAPVLHYAKQRLVSNCDVDVTSCHLKVATFYYQTGQKERCVQTVIDVLQRYTAETVVWCTDTTRSRTYRGIPEYEDRVMVLLPLCQFKAQIAKCAYPVIFSRWELSFSPTAIQELALVRQLRTTHDQMFSSLTIIDPLVYAYYLLVIAEHDLGRERRCRRAMMRLRHIVNNPRVYYLFYPEAASFLLEYCERYVSN